MDDFHCSFCGKRRREVRKLISGPRVFICNECVARCRQILGPPPPPEATPAQPERTTADLPAQTLPDDEDVTAEKKPPDDSHCSFCGKAKTDVGAARLGPDRLHLQRVRPAVRGHRRREPGRGIPAS